MEQNIDVYDQIPSFNRDQHRNMNNNLNPKNDYDSNSNISHYTNQPNIVNENISATKKDNLDNTASKHKSE